MATYTSNQLRPFLDNGRFDDLFLGTLGWDNPVRFDAFSVSFTYHGETSTYQVVPVAQKENLLAVSIDVGAAMPNGEIRRMVERKIVAFAHEHLIIFHTTDFSRQIWQVLQRKPGEAIRLKERKYGKGESFEELREFLEKITFTIADQRTLTLLDVMFRLEGAVEADKVTRKFYQEFDKVRSGFVDQITGILPPGFVPSKNAKEVTPEEADRNWYAAVMLNRLMFTWFLQSKKLLNNDDQYLITKLEAAKMGKLGGESFQSFYLTFLKHLFHDGFNKPLGDRGANTSDLIGDIPYINGGIFGLHQLEQGQYAITIPDEAFDAVFTLFRKYSWHLDDRPLAKENEINPDVLGHIFEKFVNQKEKGAYYTKEDVTGYMSQNTIIPWLLDHAKKKVAIAFDHTHPGSVWQLLVDAPTRYIYPSMKHGVVDANDDVVPLADAIAAGETDYSQRTNWNQRATEPYALPTETWREYFHRRKRTVDLIDMLQRGEVHAIDDLITWNLDIRQFVQDIVEMVADISLVKALWNGVRDITILDPTVGSGAFLFAAVRVLEPIADGLLDRMEALAEAEPNNHPNSNITEFNRILAERNAHPNQRYYIMRQIILHNLYGVDIEEEAVEICKLRLFLLLVATLEDPKHIEPLPDLDFNIRAGNSLVGYATESEVKRASGSGQMTLDFDGTFDGIVKLAQKIDCAAHLFRQAQSQDTVHEMRAAKSQLTVLSDDLNSTLDAYLAIQLGLSGKGKSRISRIGPLHWYAAFYQILEKRHGFDVILGNPPYVETSGVSNYQISADYKTQSCGNLYANLLERSKNLLSNNGRLGMIVPLSGHSTARMQPLVDHVYQQFQSLWMQNLSGDANPSTLFEGVKFRLATVIGHRPNRDCLHGWTTGYRKWFATERPHLFTTTGYSAVEVRKGSRIPKQDSSVQRSVELKLARQNGLANHSSRTGAHVIYYHNAPVSWIRAHSEPPYFESEREGIGVSTQLKRLNFANTGLAKCVAAGLCSTMLFQHWIAVSDCYHLNKPEIDWFPVAEDAITLSEMSRLSHSLGMDMERHSRIREYRYKTTGLVKYAEFYLKKSKQILDEIDIVLAKSFGLNEEEIDWLLNFMWKYRMGSDE